jgi:hypothetical protein
MGIVRAFLSNRNSPSMTTPAKLTTLIAVCIIFHACHFLKHRLSAPRRALKSELTHLDHLLPGWARAQLERNLRVPHRNFNGCGGVCPQAGCALLSLELDKRSAKDQSPMAYWVAGEREQMTVDGKVDFTSSV